MKKNILISIGSLQVGGAETVLVDLLNNFDLNKMNIDLLLIEKRGELLKRLNNKINIKYLTKSNEDCHNIFTRFFNKAYRSIIYRFLSNYKWYAKYVYKKVLKKEYDTEVAFLMVVPGRIIKNSPNSHSKKIMWLHIDLNYLTAQKLQEYYKLCNSYDIIVAPSDNVYASFKKNLPNCPAQLLMIHNYIDVKKIEKLSLMEQHVFHNDKPKHFLAVGRLAPQKCYERLIEAIALLNKEYDDFDVNILGIGPDEQKLKKMCSDLKVSNIYFHGLKTNPYPYFKEADMYILSSNAEGYPTVLVEATLLNKLIVTTNVAGVQEILKNYNQAFIVEKSVKDLYNGIKKAYNLIGKSSKPSSLIREENDKNLAKVESIILRKEE